VGNKTLSFKGNHKEIGEQIGEQYKKWGKKEVYIAPYANSYYPEQLKIYQKWFPQFIEYLEGVVKAMNISKDKVLTSYLTGFLSSSHTKPFSQCSALAFKNGGGVFVGRNYDWVESSEKISSLLNYEFTDNSANNFTAITDMATWKIGKPVPQHDFVIMTDDAWNNKGLYISLNGAPGKNANIGMCVTHVIQCVVEQCTTTKEAIKLISQLPINQTKIFTIADKSGDLAVVEKSLEKGCFIRKSNEMIFTTNHYNHPKLILENLSIFADIPFHATFGRYHYLEYNLLKNKDYLDLDKILSLLTKPPVQQNWRGVDNGDTVTIWTYGLNLTTGKYKIIFAPILREKEIINN